MRIINFVLLLIFSLPVCFGQDIDYARRIISDLSAPEFHGRGFTSKGEKKAAAYLKSELERMNIQAIGNGYFQEFSVPVNTLKGKVSLVIDGNTLAPGIDYIILNTSSSCKGTFSYERIDSSLFEKPGKKDFSDKFIVIDASDWKSEKSKELYAAIKYGNALKARGIIDLVEQKPSQMQCQQALPFAVAEVCRGKIENLKGEICLSFKNKFYSSYPTQNVIGYIEGQVDTFIMIGAHYDHLGDMGKEVYFPGAHDNASGCAMVLDFARHFSSQKERPYYGMIFIFFSAEEVGILGSEYYTKHPLIPLEKTKFFINLDLLGTGEEGMMVVNGAVLEKEFSALDSINTADKLIPAIKKRGEAMNSDHYYFYKSGVRSIFIYTLGGKGEYHSIYDKPETLSLAGYNGIFSLLEKFIDQYR